MLKIKYPEPAFKVRQKEGKDWIFDGLRKRWLVLTPEEWVRQNSIAFFVKELNYPQTLIAQEKLLHLGSLKKRFDILIYDAEQKPWMMVECKEPAVPLTDEVLHQLLRYQISLPAPYLIITNGEHCMGWQRTPSGLSPIDAWPPWSKDLL